MKRLAFLILLLPLAALAACGGETSPEDDVTEVANQILEAKSPEQVKVVCQELITPGMLRSVMEAHERDAKVVGVIGHRVNRRDDWVKRLSSRIANGFRNAMLKDGVPDVGCGLKAVRLDWYLKLPCFNHMHRYVPTLIQAYGGAMHVHPVNHRPRVAGVSKYGVWNRLWVGLVDVLGVWWLKRRAKVAAIRETLP